MWAMRSMRARSASPAGTLRIDAMSPRRALMTRSSFGQKANTSAAMNTRDTRDRMSVPHETFVPIDWFVSFPSVCPLCPLSLLWLEQHLADNPIARRLAEVVILHRHAAIVANQKVLVRAERHFVHVPERFVEHVRLDQRLAVDQHDAGRNRNPFTGHADDPLDVDHA